MSPLPRNNCLRLHHHQQTSIPASGIRSTFDPLTKGAIVDLSENMSINLSLTKKLTLLADVPKKSGHLITVMGVVVDHRPPMITSKGGE